MAETKTPFAEPKVVETPEELEKKAAVAKAERREKEKEVVRKQVDDAAAAHAALGQKFLKEDAEEAAKKADKK